MGSNTTILYAQVVLAAANTGADTTASGRQGPTPATSSLPQKTHISCTLEKWNATMENWKDANFDEEIKMWVLDLNTSTRTDKIIAGSYPTRMLRINSGFGKLASIKEVVVVRTASVRIHQPPEMLVRSPPIRCPNMSRWVYLVWQAMFNIFNMHYAMTSMVIQGYNDQVMTVEPSDSDNVNNLLKVLSGATFVEIEWNRYMYETALSADVIFRSINNIWQGGRGYYTYVSFTNLDDDESATKFKALKAGVVAS
ncbi:hypothetical protein MMC21_003765 [Puttea exsequens]|nr:hypothetical protein [Puttea exsequens]